LSLFNLECGIPAHTFRRFSEKTWGEGKKKRNGNSEDFGSLQPKSAKMNPKPKEISLYRRGRY